MRVHRSHGVLGSERGPIAASMPDHALHVRTGAARPPSGSSLESGASRRHAYGRCSIGNRVHGGCVDEPFDHCAEHLREGAATTHLQTLAPAAVEVQLHGYNDNVTSDRQQARPRIPPSRRRSPERKSVDSRGLGADRDRRSSTPCFHRRCGPVRETQSAREPEPACRQPSRSTWRPTKPKPCARWGLPPASFRCGPMVGALWRVFSRASEISFDPHAVSTDVPPRRRKAAPPMWRRSQAGRDLLPCCRGRSQRLTGAWRCWRRWVTAGTDGDGADG